MSGNQSSQTSASSGTSLKDHIDYDSLGDYAPDNEIEETILDMALSSFERASELNQKYLEKVRNPYDDPRDMLEGYKDLYMKTGETLDPELFQEIWSTGRESAEDLKSMRDLYLEMAESTLEDYIELKEDRADFKQQYVDWFGVDGFDLDPEEGSVDQQVTMEDILDDFLANQLNRN